VLLLIFYLDFNRLGVRNIHIFEKAKVQKSQYKNGIGFFNHFIDFRVEPQKSVPNL
jgi:hypothetical protein